MDDFVEKAGTILHEQETWLAANRSDIHSKIDEGFASAQRGELIDADEVRSRLTDRKRAPLSV